MSFKMSCRWIVLLLLFWASLAGAWSRSVHTDLGAIVWENLSKKEQRYYAKLATYLPIENMDFANMSSWVDSVRGTPVDEVFERKAPAALRNLKNRHSGNWHFENSFYFKPNQYFRCDLTNSGQLQSALTAIDTALNEKKTKLQEAILVAFAIHMLEDAHQPLHTGTLVRSDCTIDRGGNRYCLKKYASECVLNLHQLWDTAFDITRKKAFKKQKLTVDKSRFELDIEISRILMEGENLLPLVYSVEENRIPSEGYLNVAIPTAEERLNKSAERVLHYLKQHYAKSKK